MMSDAAETASDGEEEIIVYAEFEDSVRFDKYNSIHILGIDTKKPIFQLDDTFFTGTYENPLGTYMFFEEDPSPTTTDPLFDKLPEKSLKYLCKTRKFINVEHAYVTAKQNRQEQEEHLNEEPTPANDDIQLVNFKNIQEALDHYKKELEKNNTNE